MVEYQIGNAKVRIHGSPDPETLREATMKFLKQAEFQRKKGSTSKTEKSLLSGNAS